MLYKLWCKMLGQTCNWVNHDEIKVWSPDSDRRPSKIITIMKCETCGELKKFSVSG